ncbi:hypothetical protein RYX36_017220, partial [Vicia faba]
GANVSVRFSDYDRVPYVLNISKFFCENPAMSNFGIGQVKFDMRLLHLIIVKIIYKKTMNLGSVNDNDIYLMWLLIDSGKFYLEEFIEKVYDNKVVEPPRDPPMETTTSSTSSGLLLVEMKTYLDELVGKLLSDNQIIEERIMAQIDSLARDSEGIQVQLKTKLKVELKKEIQASEGRMDAHIESLNASVYYMSSNNHIFYADSTNVVANVTIPIIYDVAATPHTSEFADVFSS